LHWPTSRPLEPKSETEVTKTKQKAEERVTKKLTEGESSPCKPKEKPQIKVTAAEVLTAHKE